MKTFPKNRGITLIEMLVVLSGTVFLGGMAYAVYDETQTASVKMTRRQAAIDFAVLAMDEIVSSLRGAIDPTDLKQGTQAAASFKSDSVSFPSYRENAVADGLYLVSIEPMPPAEGKTESPTWQRRETPVVAGSNTAPLTRPVGDKAPEFTVKVSFAYATEVLPGADVAYRAELNPGEWPALIEVTVQADVPKDPRSIVMRTAVVPGYLPRRAAATPPPAVPAPQPVAPAPN